ncbi:polyphenol oxidase family protein [Psychrobacter sp.]|uniref:polyphenol oxidase family protein n=1 Tax=Psychrobacter sp. TaxID=56811 RepID=UPI0025F387A0|nr:polyphenol oxidase family protein [Psychrobacter sp.]
MPILTHKEPFQILAHSDKVLIIQTNAGVQLASDATAKSNSYGLFNLGLHVHDDPINVLHNRAQLLQLINEYLATSHHKSTVEVIHWLSQIHSNKVIRIDKNEPYKGSLSAPEADAMIINHVNQALAIMTADCVPIVIYDPKSGQTAAIHAGWQGLANGVIFETFYELNKHKISCNKQTSALEELNTSTSNSATSSICLLKTTPQAWIGACISQACYEVSQEVVDKLVMGCEKLGMDIEMVRHKIVGNHDDPNKAWLDLPKLAKLQLNQLGIQVEAPIGSSAEASFDEKKDGQELSSALACSYADSRYYSYRRKTHLGENNTGRMALLIIKFA